MIGSYKFLLKLCFGIINLSFILQIALMILVFLTSMYWFCDLIGTDWFLFTKDIAISISDLVKHFYSKDILIGGVFVDSSLLLFDIFAIGLVILITKSKYYIYKLINIINEQISICKKNIEEEFNNNLKKEAIAELKKNNNVGLSVEFKIKRKFDNYILGEKPDETLPVRHKNAYKILENSIKTLGTVKIINRQTKLLVFLEDFDKIDTLLYFVETTAKKLQEKLKKENYVLSYFCAVDVYPNNQSKEETTKNLNKLMKLEQKNEIICFGNFNLRYQIKQDSLYDVVLRKGMYSIDGGLDVYNLVKKS